jgi:hypothetical protein
VTGRLYFLISVNTFEGYVILSITQLIISLLLILADRQHVSALFKSPSSALPVDNRYTKTPHQWDPITYVYEIYTVVCYR